MKSALLRAVSNVSWFAFFVAFAVVTATILVLVAFFALDITALRMVIAILLITNAAGYAVALQYASTYIRGVDKGTQIRARAGAASEKEKAQIDRDQWLPASKAIEFVKPERIED